MYIPEFGSTVLTKNHLTTVNLHPVYKVYIVPNSRTICVHALMQGYTCMFKGQRSTCLAYPVQSEHAGVASCMYNSTRVANFDVRS